MAILRTAFSRTLGASARSTTTAAGRMLATRSKHTLPDLPYDFGALEPSISGQIMELHHQKHHQTYVNGLNAAEEQLQEAVSKNDVKAAIAVQKALNFNGGGHVNHSLFWQNLAPSKNGGGELPDGTLKEAIDRDFGSLDQLKTKFNAQIAAIQGSGWGWLGYNPATGKLDIVTTANQDPLLSHVPLIGVDAWEHAFCMYKPLDSDLDTYTIFSDLQYKNVKADYFKAIWDVINFRTAEDRLKQASK